MKIIYAAATPIPTLDANNVHVMKMGQALAANGHKVTVIAPEYNRKEPAPKIGDPFSWFGVKPVFRLKHTWNVKPARLGVLSHALTVSMNAIFRRADLVYCRCLASALVAAKLGLPVAFEQHTSYGPEDGAAWKIYKALLGSKNLKGLVVISEALKNHVAKVAAYDADKIIVAHDGADPLLAVSGPPPFARPAGRLQAGYTGHLYEGRGIDVLGEVARLVPEIDINIVGGRPEEIARWREKLGAPPNMIFHGHVAPSEVAGYIRAFDVLLAPYQKQVRLQGGMDTTRFMSPLKIFEYMATGKPVICSDIPVLREVLRPEENAILCAPDDAKAWAAALERIKGDPALAQRLGAAALRNFTAHYSWKARARAIMGAVMRKAC